MKNVGIAFLLLIAAGTALAQQAPDAPQIVVTVLSLSEDQTRALGEMLQARQAAVQPLAEQLQSREQALGQMLQTAQPDPAALGRLLLEVKSIREQVGHVAADAASQFEQVLDPDQQQRLEQIRAAAQVCPAVPAFQAVGLIR
jgi:Spy/CpxP family protein refolding chaperone